MRIKCKLLACACSRDFAGCPRCGAALHDSEFIQIGWLDHWFRFCGLVSVWRCFMTRRCHNCGARMWFTSKPLCSQKCADDWMPF